MKPIPLSAFNSSFVPPVTGVNRQLAPVANSFDTSGHFRPRSGSKRIRVEEEEIDCVFDLSATYPPLLPPSKGKLNITKVRELMVKANSCSEEIKKIAENPAADSVTAYVCKMNIAMLEVINAIVEDGLIPVCEAGGPAWRGPPVPPKPPAGLAELKSALEKSEKECIVFDAELSTHPTANRNALANGLSAGINKAILAGAPAASPELAEALREAEDALSCVSDMDFLGTKSQKFENRRDPNDKKNGTFCTMPVKMTFEDKSSRINFERVAKNTMKIRAVQSLPKPIRVEQQAFHKALKDRYKDDIVMVRPDLPSLALIAFRKKDGERRWVRCRERLLLDAGTMLPGYAPRREIVLPPDIDGAGGGSGSSPQGASQSDNTVPPFS